jgi:hypothetical protein
MVVIAFRIAGAGTTFIIEKEKDFFPWQLNAILGIGQEGVNTQRSASSGQRNRESSLFADCILCAALKLGSGCAGQFAGTFQDADLGGTVRFEGHLHCRLSCTQLTPGKKAPNGIADVIDF